MCTNKEVFLCSLILSVLKLSNYCVTATYLPLENEKGTKISSESLTDDKSNVYYEMPLDLTVKNRIRNQEINFYKQPLINFMPTSFTKNLSFLSLNLHQSEPMISDPLISSTTLQKKEVKN
jgi:hypothetical protein